MWLVSTFLILQQQQHQERRWRQTLLENYRAFEFQPTEENFDKGWKERGALEFEIVNGADAKILRAALQDPDRFVRSIAAPALGVLADETSADLWVELAQNDPESIVRTGAIEALGLMKLEVMDRAKRDRSLGVRGVAEWEVGQLEQDKN